MILKLSKAQTRMIKFPKWRNTAFPRPCSNWLITLGWAVLVVSFGLISTISMMSVTAPPSGGNIDKVLHILAYAVLTFGMVFALPKRSLVLIFFSSFCFGLIIEFMQGTLSANRTASWADALANGIGALGIIVFWVWICPRLKHNLA